MPKWVTAEQGTDQWLLHRVGKLTGSRMADAMAFLKNGAETEARRKLKLQILAERLTGRMTETYQTEAMKWGIEQEPNAKAHYEETTGELITNCGFALHDTLDGWGASPDGLLGKHGLLEIKCPATTTHLDYLLAGVVPEKYKPQMLCQLAVTERKWCQFMSYDPRLPDEWRSFVVRYEPSKEELEEVTGHAKRFLCEVQKMVDSR
jgi:putative phage-type endonuclease